MKVGNKGFTLVELLVVLFVIIAGGAIITVPLRDHTTSMRNQEALETLTKLNGLVDLYRSEFGELPSGGNDAGHHRNVLALLGSTSHGRNLLESQTVCVEQLESSGNGDTFRFTKYKGVNAPAVTLLPESVLADRSPSAWTNDSDGIDTVPIPTEVVSPANVLVETRLASNAVHGSVIFDQPGKYEWIVPDGVTQVRIEGIGGGGSGGVAQKLSRLVTKTRRVKKRFCERVEVVRPVERSRTVRYSNYELIRCEKYYNYRTVWSYDYLSGGDVMLSEPYEEDKEIWGWVSREKEETYTENEYVTEDRWYDREVDEPYTVTEYYDVPGKGGKAGQYQQQTTNGLKGGEHVFIFVGKGGNNSNGEDTILVINGQRLSYRGGLQASHNVITGELITFCNSSGKGGVGQNNPQNSLNRNGGNGCVRITY